MEINFNKNSDFNLLNKNFNSARRTVRNAPENNNEYLLSQLTNKKIPRNQFLKNDVMPHFKGNVKQNIICNSERPEISLHNSNNFKNKKASTPLFSPVTNVNALYGSANSNEIERARIYQSRYRNNNLPFEQITVGRGTQDGYTAKPSGGFHPDYRDIMMPRTVDELRTASNPKQTFKGRTKSGKAVNNRRAKLGKYEKRTPDTFYVQNPENYLRTTGAVKKEEQRPAIYLKDTNRKDSVNYTPSANPITKGDAQRSLYKASSKNVYKQTKPRNLNKINAWENNKFGDYGKNTIENKVNERQTTENNNPLVNFNSVAKAIIAPILDVLKPTKKENFIGNNRPDGNMNVSVPKSVVYDENDVPRTTIKETNIENSHNGNLKGSTKMTAYDPTDVARKTIKETNIENSHTGNLKGVIKLTTYDPNDVARTTIKETNIENSHSGNLKGPIKLTIYDPNLVMPDTNRQFTSNNQYAGQAENQGRGLGYITNEQNAPNTNRQTTTDNEYGGSANSYYKKTKSYSADLNSRINYSKEKTLQGRKPTPESVKLMNGGDSINMTSDKLFNDGVNNREPTKGKVYINSYNNASIHNKDKHRYNYTILDEQINPILLKPFNNNPYTQPLNSI